jgi:hypothetical protein
MACCAMPGGCGNPDCYLCTVVANLPQPETYAEHVADTNAARDGTPTLAAERKRGHLAFQKRTRAGANWVPRERRI